MSYELPAHLIPAFNRRFERGTELARDVIILDDGTGLRKPKPGFWARRKARKALQHLQQCTAMLPEHWPSLWVIGKIWQALGEQQTALAHFARAVHLHPTQVDLLREASIAAVDAGAPAEAVQFSALALQQRPDDSGLLCNHAVNLLLNGQDEAALTTIGRALALEPTNAINRNADRLIRAVLAGTRARPTWQELASR